MGELPVVGGMPLAAAVAALVVFMEEDDDDNFQVLMNVVNIAAVEWMEMDGDDEIGLEQLRTWQHITVNIDEYHMLHDYSFRLHFRMSRRVFEILVQTVGNHLEERGRIVRRRTPLQDILLMVIWIMATPDTFRSVALRFGVNPGTLYYFYSYIIQALREMSNQYITWPNQEERAQIQDAFLRVSGFPGIVGCIDGTHVFVTKPVRNAAQYRNRHHNYSLNVQAVIDNNLLVRDVTVGEVGSLSDNRVFRRSALCRDLVLGANDRLNVNDEHLVGDGGYTLADFMLIPFANNGHLTPAQINFNRALSQCRVRVENGFGRAKGKWRRIKMLHVRNEEIAVDHILCAAQFHCLEWRTPITCKFLDLSTEEELLLVKCPLNWYFKHFQEQELRRPINANEVLGDEDFEDEHAVDEEIDGDYHRLLDEAQARGQEKRILIMDHPANL